MALLEALSSTVGDVFEQQGLDRALGQVRFSDRPDLAQFQCNGALAAAKAQKKNPREIAEAIASALRDNAVFEKVELAGPGFINLTLTDAALSERANAWRLESAFAGVSPKPEKLVIDYGGPNVAKPLHVGHLRAAIIGECLKRLFRATGDEVVADVHLGDWGLPMGQLITELKREQPDLPYFEEGDNGPYPEDPPVSLADLERLYPQASAACKESPDRAEEARAATAALQKGRPGYRALWGHFVAVSRAAIESEYGDLGVTFDLWHGESHADPFMAKTIASFRDKELVQKDDGAEIVAVARADDKKKIPPLILLKSDGSVLYGTTDLATIVDRAENIAPDRMIYVVDQRQALHFVQVFRSAALAGLFPEEKLEHIGFGTINGKDGKPFKTREGGALRLRKLIDQAVEKALERMAESGVGKDMPAAEKADVARKIAIAALKFADLSNPRTSDYIFDLDRFVAFEGKTGPYLLYAAVRIASVLEKTGDQPGDIDISLEEERQLALKILSFEGAVAAAKEKRMPHLLCDHAYELAQAFSKFYSAARISDEADAGRRQSRLRLSTVVRAQLLALFDILGFEAPARM